MCLLSHSGGTLRLRKVSILASNIIKEIHREWNLLERIIVAAAKPFDLGNTQNEQMTSAELPIEHVKAIDAG